MIMKLERYFAVISKGKYNMTLDAINAKIIRTGNYFTTLIQFVVKY